MLRRGTRAFFDYLERNAPAWTLLYSESSVAGEALEGIRAQQTDFIAALLAVQAPAGRPAAAAGLGAGDRRGVRAAGALAEPGPHGVRGAGHRVPDGPGLGGSGARGTIVGMSTTAPRLLQVRRSIRVTPRMVRVTLGGDELAGFGGEGPDRRIKMFFPVPGQERPAVPRATSGGPLWPAGEPRPTIRTYTVRRFDPGSGELDVDFVLHEGHGPAAAWARDAQPGSWVGVSEPGGRYEPDPAAAFHVVIGDETALPAVATVLDALSSPTPPAPPASPGRRRARTRVPRGGRRGRGAGAARHAPTSGGCTGATASRASRSPRPCTAAELPAGDGQAWLSGESACVRDLRKHLLDDRGFDRRRVYATGYWRAR